MKVFAVFACLLACASLGERGRVGSLASPTHCAHRPAHCRLRVLARLNCLRAGRRRGWMDARTSPTLLPHALACTLILPSPCLPTTPIRPGRANIVDVAVSVPDLSTLVAAVQVRAGVAGTHGFRCHWQLACAASHYHALPGKLP
jgi:hypothetical protein